MGRGRAAQLAAIDPGTIYVDDRNAARFAGVQFAVIRRWVKAGQLRACVSATDVYTARPRTLYVLLDVIQLANREKGGRSGTAG